MSPGPVLWAVAALSLVAGCGMFAPHEKGAEPKRDIGLSTAVKSLTQEDTAFLFNQPQFAFRLAKTLDMGSDGSNACVSPFAIEQALALVLNGAQDESFEACARVMGLQDPRVDKMNYANSKCLDILASQAGQPVHIANSLWNVLPMRFSKIYEGDMDKYYGAEVFKLGSARKGALRQVNDWVKERTEGAIPEILDKLNDQSATIIVNALTFEGEWAQDFTSPKPTAFAAPAGAVSAQMVTGDVDCRTASGKGFTSVTLPYDSGSLSMTFVLPNPGTPLRSLLDSSTFDIIDQKSSSAMIEVSFPRFAVDSRLDAIPVLSKMGGAKLFTPTNDFGLMSHEMRNGAEISDFLHVVRFQTEEKGSYGAAGNVIKTKQIPAKFVLNRPFLYFVWETNTKSILFLGVVNDPTKN